MTQPPGYDSRAVLRRVVIGVVGATGVVTVSFWALVIGVSAGAAGEGPGGGSGGGIAGAWALSLALVPFAFMVSAFGSMHDRAAGAVVWAMVLALGAGAALLALADPATALIGAFAAGATVTVRQTPQTSMQRRAAFALGVAVVTGLLMQFFLVGGLLLAPALPFPAIAYADRTTR